MSRRLDSVTSGLTAVNDKVTLTPADLANVTELGIYIEFDANAGAGTLLIETASAPDYTGTWAVLATVNWASANKCHYTGITDSVRALRVRVSSTVTSGTAKVTIVGNLQ